MSNDPFAKSETDNDREKTKEKARIATERFLKGVSEALKSGAEETKRQAGESAPSFKTALGQMAYAASFSAAYGGGFGTTLVEELIPESLREGVREGFEAGKKAAERANAPEAEDLNEDRDDDADGDDGVVDIEYTVS